MITHQGRVCRLYAFVLTLGWSRAMYVRFTTSMEQIWFIRCHLHAFSYLGGVPRRLLYDNLGSVVNRHDSDGTVHWNARFLDFADVSGFARPRLPPVSAEDVAEKWRTGSNMCVAISGRGFIFRISTISIRKPYIGSTPWPTAGSTERPTRIPFTRLQKEQLLPLAGALAYDTSVITARRASRDCVISYAGNLYSLPSTSARQSVQVKVTEAEELIICSVQGIELARHQLLLGSRKLSLQPQHSPGVPIPSTPAVRGRPTTVQQVASLPTAQPFWEAPVVEVRSLSVYEQVLEALP